MVKKNMLVPVSARDLKIIEYRGQRVATTEQLATGYGTDAANLKVNYSRNAERFIEGKHFFKVTGQELTDLRVTFSYLQISSKTRSLMLWTERGAANHAKMLETDRAWDYFNDLAEFYFNRRDALSPPTELSRLEILQIAMDSEKGRLAEKARADEAERTKAEIGTRREATAMATASAAVRRSKQLAERLGEFENHATVKAVKRITEIEYPWRPLKKWCRDNDVEPSKAPDEQYGFVNSWPREAWLAVFGVDLRVLFGGDHG